jgi:MATE family multidrug resistance protein
MLRKIVNLGLPSAMQMLFEVTLFTAAIWLSGSLGKNSQAANQIALTLASSTFMVAMGLSVTAMIRVSHSKGLADFKNMIVVARSIFLLAIILETIFGVLFVVFHNYLPHLFLNMTDSAQLLDNQEIIGITAQLLLVAAVFQLSDGIQVVVLGALRGLQDVKIPMYITFVAYWLIGFPISFYLGKYTELKAIGIWIGLLAGLTAAALFLYIRFKTISQGELNFNYNYNMELPKFLLGDNTDFPDDIFIIHLDYPRFIINLKDDEVEFMEEAEDLDEAELNAEMEALIVEANEFYDREIGRYEE